MASDAAQWASTIDEFGDLERRYVEAKPWLDRREDLRKKIESHYVNEAADESFSASGKVWQIVVGPRANRRIIVSMAKLFKLLGAKEFFEHCTFPMTALDRLSVDTTKIVKQERSGTRTIMAIPRESLSAPPREQKKASTATKPEAKVEEVPV